MAGSCRDTSSHWQRLVPCELIVSLDSADLAEHERNKYLFKYVMVAVTVAIVIAPVQAQIASVQIGERRIVHLITVLLRMAAI